MTKTFQTLMNEYANQAMTDFLGDYPDAALSDVINGMHDGISDAPAIYAEANPEPEPLDPETIAARQDSYRRDMIDAGRGHLLGDRS